MTILYVFWILTFKKTYSYTAHCTSIAVPGLSVVGASGDYSLLVVHELLIALASLVAERGLSSCGSWALLTCGMWDLSNQGPDLCACIVRQILNH